MKILTYITLILLLMACASTDEEYFEYGEPVMATHMVSLYEILGNTSWYDKQPISIKGVAAFDFRRDAASGIYATKEDYNHFTYGWLVLDIDHLPKELHRELLKLNGSFINIQGIFHKYKKSKLPTPEQQKNKDSQILTICKGICGAAGYIEVIRIW